MKKFLIAFLCSLTVVSCFRVYTQSWSALYQKELSFLENNKYHHKKEMLYAKSNTLPFTQLIFSWNAQRPVRGYFTFWISAQDAESKRWYEWHKMMDWGKNKQQTYSSISKNGTSYHHVRLELPLGKKGNAFRLKIEAVQGADLANMRNIYVSVADYKRFKSDVGDKRIYKLPSVQIRDIPLYSQMKLNHKDADRMCSPTSSSMLINTLCVPYTTNPLSFATHVYDKGLDTYGNWAFNTAHAYEVCRNMFSFHVERLASFLSLYDFLRKGIPVVVSIRGRLPGAAKAYESGHLVVVVGYDAHKKKVLCHDPAFSLTKKVFVSYDLDNFLRAWEKSRRLTYIAQPLL